MFVLFLVLMAEAANGWTDAPCGTSAAVATKVLNRNQALLVTVAGNAIGLLLALLIGAKVAATIGTGIVRPEMVSVTSIGVAMATTVLWSVIAALVGIPVSKTHSLLAALAGIGFAVGGFEALTPSTGNWADSGWVKAGQGVIIALILGSAVSYFFALVARKIKIPEQVWRHFQVGTVCFVSSGHGFNDGLKYVGIFTLVLYKAGIISTFHVHWWTILLCAFVMGVGTLVGGWKIHDRIDRLVNHIPQAKEKQFEPYQGVVAEFVSGCMIWQTGWLGIPTSTNHATVSAMAGARSADGKVHIGSLVRIFWGWVITYFFCAGVAWGISRIFLG